MAIRDGTDNLIAFLNELLVYDRNAVACLIANRVPCNEALGEHPTVQTGKQHGGYHVGLLGILNGYCGVFDEGPRKDWGPITAVFEDCPGEDRRLARFERTELLVATQNAGSTPRQMVSVSGREHEEDASCSWMGCRPAEPALAEGGGCG